MHNYSNSSLSSSSFSIRSNYSSDTTVSNAYFARYTKPKSVERRTKKKKFASGVVSKRAPITTHPSHRQISNSHMALFRNFFGGGAPEQEDENGAELVETFVERVETCSAPEDRRDALRALRSLAERYRLAVGTMGLNAYVEILEKERMNTEAVALVLDTMAAVLASEQSDSDGDELGERLAEIMLKRNGFIPSVLAAVDQFDFAVRRSAVRLLTSLLNHRGPEVQNLIMGHPMGVSKLVDIVHDNREAIRNEAILMICELSRSNSQIQQLLAYDNLFVILLDVIETEPLDSIVVEDSLYSIQNLLRKNAMNQQLFRENNLISRLAHILHNFLYGHDGGDDVEVESAEWEKQRTANVIFLLETIRTLISPNNTSQNIHAAQKAIYQTKILAELCRVLLSEIGASVEILTNSMIVVAEAIRGNYTNQEYFASTNLVAEDGGTRSALLVLLISMTNEKQPFKLRSAVYYCFLSYLFENEFGKTKIVETLLPQSSQQVNPLSTGALICQAISSSEASGVWFGSLSLMHCLYDVDHLCEQLLRVQLNITSGDESLSLLDHVTQLLISMGNRRPQMRAGLLMLIGVWLHNCPQAVRSFMEKDDNLQYMTTHIVDECGEGSESEQQVLRGLIAFILISCLKNLEGKESRQSMEALIERRVGKETVISAIEGLSRTEQFVRAAQRPQPSSTSSKDLFLDFYFIKLFKSLEGGLIKQLRPNGEFNGTANNDSIIQSFKELIKRQDEEISVLKAEAKRSNAEIEKLRAEADQRELEKELEELRAKLEQACTLKSQHDTVAAQLSEAQRLTQQWYGEAERYKQWAQQWQSYQLGQVVNGAEIGLAQLQNQVTELEQQLAYGYQAFEQQSQTILHYTTENARLRESLEKTENSLATATKNLEEAARKPEMNGNDSSASDSAELAKLRQEQEELLMLLADQHNKLAAYRRSLKTMGHAVTDDEDEE